MKTATEALKDLSELTDVLELAVFRKRTRLLLKDMESKIRNREETVKECHEALRKMSDRPFLDEVSATKAETSARELKQALREISIYMGIIDTMTRDF